MNKETMIQKMNNWQRHQFRKKTKAKKMPLNTEEVTLCFNTHRSI